MARDYPALVAALSLACGDRGQAEDAVQEAACRALLARRRGRSIEVPSAWIRVVALNLVRNRLRSAGREQVAVRRMGARLMSPTTEGGAALTDHHVDLTRAIVALPRREREAFSLYYRLDLSVAEVAQTMGVTDGTVKTWLHRARASLALALALDPES